MMTKFFKLIGIFNLIFTIVILFAMLTFFIDNNSSTGLALALSSLSLIIVSLILTVPFLFFLKKKGYRENKFYVLTHISLFLFSLIGLLASNVLS